MTGYSDSKVTGLMAVACKAAVDGPWRRTLAMRQPFAVVCLAAVVLAAAPSVHAEVAITPETAAKAAKAKAGAPHHNAKAGKAKVSDAWQSRTDVTPTDAADNGTLAADSPCVPLNRNMQLRIATIRRLQEQTEMANAAPPKTVVGTFQKLMGETYVSPIAAKNSRKIAEARKAADDINSMLVASQCPSVDIDIEVSKASVANDPIKAPSAIAAPVIDDNERSIFDAPVTH